MPGNRYRKQEIFSNLGPEGQAALARSSVLVAGLGATGGTMADLLVRAGVGRVRVVDRDFPELGNLTRQLLYDEESLASGLPKALLAEKALKKTNSQVKVEASVADVSPENVLDLIDGIDLILDGLDNQETRYLINDAAVSRQIPWVYAGCLGASGNVMLMIPEVTPCLRCLFPEPAPPGALPTCDTAGIIGPAAGLTASMAAAEALKYLSGQKPADPPRLMTFDLWSGLFRAVEFPQGPEETCPCCGRKQFDFLTGNRRIPTETLCGSEAVQVSSPAAGPIDLKRLAQKLDPETIISANEHLLRFQDQGLTLAVFPDGRVIVQGTADHSLARAAAGRFIGF